MDDIDYAIFRYLSPDGQVRFWASRRVVDPRVSAREIAAKVGLSEAGVRARLRTLQDQGFLRGRETWLNPSIFGASIVVAEIPIRDPGDAPPLLRELALVEGVVFARDILDERDRAVRVYYVADVPSGTDRRTALLRRLAPTGQVRGPTPYWIPPCARTLTRLDWRIARAFRDRPEASQAELAKAVHVSPKTAALRLRRLLDSRACWSALSSSSEEMPLALLSIVLREGAEPRTVLRALASIHPVWMPIAEDGMGSSPGSSVGVLAGLVPAEAPAALEQGLRRTLAIDGVASARRTFALGSASYPQWTDEQLAAKLRTAG